MKAVAEKLYTQGYAVFPGDFNPQRERKNFDNVLDHAGELLPGRQPYDYHYTARVKCKVTNTYIKERRQKTSLWHPAGGSFGALGLPSVDHSEWVRGLRRNWHPQLKDLSMQLLDLMLARGDITQKQYSKYCFEQVPGRIMFRQAGLKPSKESFHRDKSPQVKTKKNGVVFRGSQRGDLIFGGWANLDDEDQVFHCVPGSHELFSQCYTAQANQKGFQTFSSKEQKSLTATPVAIPSGHILVFFQAIAHEVCSVSYNFPRYRVYVHFRMSRSEDREPLAGFSSLDESLRDHKHFIVKSGQLPAVYPSLYACNFPERLQEWSAATFKPELLDEKGRVPRFLPSGRALGLKLLPYSEEERSMFVPQPLHGDKRSRSKSPTAGERPAKRSRTD